MHLITLLDYLGEYQFPPSSLQIHRIKINRLSMYEYKGIDVNVSVYRRVVTAIKLIAYTIRVVSAIHSIRPDIVQTKGVMDAIPAYITKKLYKIPYTLTLHGNPADNGSNMTGIPALSKITKKYWKYFPQFRAADEVISLTPVSRLSTLKIFHRDSVIIPNGVYINKFMPNFLKRCLQENCYNIVCVGILNNKKGFESAIISMRFIIAEIPHAHLTICGDGPLREAHTRLINEYHLENCVDLVGNVPHNEIVSYLQKSHVFLLSSVEEGLPNVLLEAIACGLPIVSTPVSISPALIDKWKNGYIVPYRDPEGIAEAVIRIFVNDEIETFSQRSLAASKSYTWESVAEEYLSLFENIVKRKS